MNLKVRQLKTIAWITLLCFLTQDISYGQPLVNPFLEYPHQYSTVLEKIPSHIASLEEFWSPGQTPVKTVVLVEDAHGHDLAQSSIKAALEFLKQEMEFDALFLEGGFGELQPERLRYFKEQDANVFVAEQLAKKDEIGGPELFVVENAGIENVFGAENLETYVQNVAAYHEVLKGQDIAEDWIETRLFDWDSRASKVLSPQFYQFLKTWQAYELGHKNLEQMLAALYQNAQAQLSLDLAQDEQQFDWPMLVRYFEIKERQHQIDSARAEKEAAQLSEWAELNQIDSELRDRIDNYRENDSRRRFWEDFHHQASPQGFTFKDYPHLFTREGLIILEQELQTIAFMDEIEQLRGRLNDSWIHSEVERDMLSALEAIFQLKKILTLSLTSDEYADFSEGFNDSMNQYPEQIQDLINQARQYYTVALQRDEVMADQILQRMTERNLKKSVLIAGGFHTRGLKRALKDRNIAYAVLRPHMTEADQQTGYHDAMDGQVDTWGLFESGVRLSSMFNSITALESAGLNMSRRRGYVADIEDYGTRHGYTVNPAYIALNERAEQRAAIPIFYHARALNPNVIEQVFNAGHRQRGLTELEFAASRYGFRKYENIWKKLLSEGGLDQAAYDEMHAKYKYYAAQHEYAAAQSVARQMLVLFKLHQRFNTPRFIDRAIQSSFRRLRGRLQSENESQTHRQLSDISAYRTLLRAQLESDAIDSPAHGPFSVETETNGAGRVTLSVMREGAAQKFELDLGLRGDYLAAVDREFDADLLHHVFTVTPLGAAIGQVEPHQYILRRNPDLTYNNERPGFSQVTDMRLLKLESDWEYKKQLIAAQTQGKLDKAGYPDFETIYRTNESGNITIKNHNQKPILFNLGFPAGAIFSMARAWDEEAKDYTYSFLLLDDDGRVMADAAGQLVAREYRLTKDPKKTRITPYPLEALRADQAKIRQYIGEHLRARYPDPEKLKDFDDLYFLTEDSGNKNFSFGRGQNKTATERIVISLKPHTKYKMKRFYDKKLDDFVYEILEVDAETGKLKTRRKRYYRLRRNWAGTREKGRLALVAFDFQDAKRGIDDRLFESEVFGHIFAADPDHESIGEFDGVYIRAKKGGRAFTQSKTKSTKPYHVELNHSATAILKIRRFFEPKFGEYVYEVQTVGRDKKPLKVPERHYRLNRVNGKVDSGNALLEFDYDEEMFELTPKLQVRKAVYEHLLHTDVDSQEIASFDAFYIRSNNQGNIAFDHTVRGNPDPVRATFIAGKPNRVFRFARYYHPYFKEHIYESIEVDPLTKKSVEGTARMFHISRYADGKPDYLSNAVERIVSADVPAVKRTDFLRGIQEKTNFSIDDFEELRPFETTLQILRFIQAIQNLPTDRSGQLQHVLMEIANIMAKSSSDRIKTWFSDHEVLSVAGRAKLVSLEKYLIDFGQEQAVVDFWQIWNAVARKPEMRKLFTLELDRVRATVGPRFELRSEDQEFSYKKHAENVMLEEARIFVERMQPVLDDEEKSTLAQGLVDAIEIKKIKSAFYEESVGNVLLVLAVVWASAIFGGFAAFVAWISELTTAQDFELFQIFLWTFGIPAAYGVAMWATTYMPSLLLFGKSHYKGVTLYLDEGDRLIAERYPLAIGLLVHEWMHELKHRYNLDDRITSAVQVLTERELTDFLDEVPEEKAFYYEGVWKWIDLIWRGGRDREKYRNTRRGYLAMRAWLKAENDTERKAALKRIKKESRPHLFDVKGIRFVQVVISKLLTLGLNSRENYARSYRLGGMALALAEHAPQQNVLAWRFLNRIAHHFDINRTMLDLLAFTVTDEFGDVHTPPLIQNVGRTRQFDFEADMPQRSEQRNAYPPAEVRKAAGDVLQAFDAYAPNWPGFVFNLKKIQQGMPLARPFAAAFLKIFSEMPDPDQSALLRHGSWPLVYRYIRELAESEQKINPGISRLLILHDEATLDRLAKVNAGLKIRESMGLTPEAVEEARNLLDEFDVVKKNQPTPLRESSEINSVMSDLMGRDVRIIFKDETVNPTGSFKDRSPILLYKKVKDAAGNAGSLPKTLAVVSTGNHAAASTVAVRRFAANYWQRLTGQILPISVQVYMGKDAEPHKIERVQELGGEVILSEANGERIESYMRAEEIVESLVNDRDVIQVRHADEHVVAGYAVAGGPELSAQLIEQGILNKSSMGNNAALLWDVGSGGFYAGAQEILRYFPEMKTYGVSAPPASLTFESVQNRLLRGSDEMVRRAVPKMNNDGIAATPEEFAVELISQMSDGLLTVPDNSTIGFVALIERYLHQFGGVGGLQSEHTTAMPLVALLLNQDLFEDRDTFIIPITSQNRSAQVSIQTSRRFLNAGIASRAITTFYRDFMRRSEWRQVSGYVQDAIERGTFWAAVTALSVFSWTHITAFLAAYYLPLIAAGVFVVLFYFGLNSFRRAVLNDYYERLDDVDDKVREFKEQAKPLKSVKEIVKLRDRIWRQAEVNTTAKKVKTRPELKTFFEALASVRGIKVTDMSLAVGEIVLDRLGYRLLHAQRTILLRKGFSEREVNEAYPKGFRRYNLVNYLIRIPGLLLWNLLSISVRALYFIYLALPSYPSQAELKEEAPPQKTKEPQVNQPETAQVLQPDVDAAETEIRPEEPEPKNSAAEHTADISASAPAVSVKQIAPENETVENAVADFFSFFESSMVPLVNMVETQFDAGVVDSTAKEYDKRIRSEMDKAAAKMSLKDQRLYKQRVSQDSRVTGGRLKISNRQSFIRERENEIAAFNEMFKRVEGKVRELIKNGDYLKALLSDAVDLELLRERAAVPQYFTETEIADRVKTAERLAVQLEEVREAHAREYIDTRFNRLRELLEKEVKSLTLKDLNFAAHEKTAEFEKLLADIFVEDAHKQTVRARMQRLFARLSEAVEQRVNDASSLEQILKAHENPLTLAAVFEQAGRNDLAESVYQAVAGLDLLWMSEGLSGEAYAAVLIHSLQAVQVLGSIYENRDQREAAYALYEDQLEFLNRFHGSYLNMPHIHDRAEELRERMYAIRPVTETELETLSETEESVQDARAKKTEQRNLSRVSGVSEEALTVDGLLERMLKHVKQKYGNQKRVMYEDVYNDKVVIAARDYLAQRLVDDEQFEALTKFRNMLSVFMRHGHLRELDDFEKQVRRIDNLESGDDLEEVSRVVKMRAAAERWAAETIIIGALQPEPLTALTEGDAAFLTEVLEGILERAKADVDFDLNKKALDWFFREAKYSVWIDENLINTIHEANRAYNRKNKDASLKIFEEVVDRLVEINDDKTRPHLRRALYGFVLSRMIKIYRSKRQFKIAEDTANQGLEQSPNNLYLEIESARIDLDSSRNRNKNDEAGRQRDLQQALEKAEKLFKINANKEPVVSLYVDVLLAWDRLDEARTVINRSQKRRFITSETAQALRKSLHRAANKRSEMRISSDLDYAVLSEDIWATGQEVTGGIFQFTYNGLLALRVREAYAAESTAVLEGQLSTEAGETAIADFAKLLSNQSKIVLPAQLLLMLPVQIRQEFLTLIFKGAERAALSQQPIIYFAGEGADRLKEEFYSYDVVKDQADYHRLFDIRQQDETEIAKRLKKYAVAVSADQVTDDAADLGALIPALLLNFEDIAALSLPDQLSYLVHMTQLQLLAAREVDESKKLSSLPANLLLAELLGKIGILYTQGPQGFLRPSTESLISTALTQYLAQYELTARSA